MKASAMSRLMRQRDSFCAPFANSSGSKTLPCITVKMGSKNGISASSTSPLWAFSSDSATYTRSARRVTLLILASLESPRLGTTVGSVMELNPTVDSYCVCSVFVPLQIGFPPPWSVDRPYPDSFVLKCPNGVVVATVHYPNHLQK